MAMQIQSAPFPPDGDQIDITVTGATSPTVAVTVQTADSQGRPTGSATLTTATVRTVGQSATTTVLHLTDIPNWAAASTFFNFIVTDSTGASAQTGVGFASPGEGDGGGSVPEDGDAAALIIDGLDVTQWISGMDGLWSGVARLQLNVSTPGQTAVRVIPAPYNPQARSVELTVDGVYGLDFPQPGLSEKQRCAARREALDRVLNRTTVQVTWQRWVGTDALGRPGVLQCIAQPSGAGAWKAATPDSGELIMVTTVELLPVTGAWREQSPAIGHFTTSTVGWSDLDRGTLDVEDAVVTFNKAGSVAVADTGTRLACTQAGVTVTLGQAMGISGAAWSDRVVSYDDGQRPLVLRPGSALTITGDVTITATPSYRNP